jgi:hypothetical protein
MAEHNEAFLAGRLIQWGLDPRSRPAQEKEYQGLIERYLDREPFRSLVQEVSRGMGLLILDVGEHGLILAPTEESLFALRPAQFRPTSASTDDRLVDGLVQLAVASTIFPRDRDLDDDSSIARPATTVEEVEETLRTICERLEEESRGRPDPSAAEEDIGRLDLERRRAVREVHTWATDKRFEALQSQIARQFALFQPDELEARAETWQEDLRLRMQTIDSQLSEMNRHRDTLISEVLAAAEEGLAVLKLAASRSGRGG